MQLRNYQRDCLDAIRRADLEGCRRQVVVLPCGTGKTAIASNIPDAIGLLPWQVMIFLVSSEELCAQAMEDITATNPSLHITLEKAEHGMAEDADVIVASVDTLAMSAPRLERLAALPIRVIFADECHSSTSPKWTKVLKALRVLKGEDDCDDSRLLCGLSATPRRHDGVALECRFDKIVFRRSIQQMAKEGWTAEMIAYRVETGLNLDGLAMRNGDFATGALSETVNTPRINALVVQKYLEYGAGLPAIAFTVDINHSECLADVFRHHDIPFEAISSNTKKAKRKELVEAHRNMDLIGLASCQALMTGFNSPPATVALWDRPTNSALFYQQGVGRVGRPYPAPEASATHTGYRKKFGVIIDFVGTSAKHRLYTASTLYGLSPQFDFKGKSITKTLEEVEAIANENRTLDITAYAGLDDMRAACNRVDLWTPAPIPKLAKSCSKFTWLATGEDSYRLTAPGMSVYLEVDLLGRYHVWKRQDKSTVDEGLIIFDQPEDGFAYADSLVPDDVMILLTAKARWRNEPPTEPQCRNLWGKDPVVQKNFNHYSAFYHFATHQFDQGNRAFSKGSVSMRIEIAKRAKEKQKVATSTK